MSTDGFVALLRRVLVAGLYVLLLTPFVVSYSTTFPFVFGKAIAYQIIIEILAALWVAVLLFDPRSRPKKSFILWALVAHALVLLITAFVGVDPHRSFWGGYERMGGVFISLHAILLPFIAVSVFRTRHEWQRFWGWGLVTATVMAGIAIAQRFSSTDIFGVHEGRVDGTLGNSIYLGQYALFFFFIGLLVAVQSKNRIARTLAVLAAALQILVVLFTESRGVLLGFFIGVAIIVFWWLIHPELAGKRFRNATIIVAACGLFVVCGLFFFGHRVALIRATPGIRSFTLEQLRSGGGTATRFMGWSIALEAWRARPIAGWGPENYRFAYDRFFHPEALRHSFYETWFDRAHNGFLDVLAMEGTLGALAILILYGSIIVVLVRASGGSRLSALGSGIGIAALAAYFGQLVFAFDSTTSILVLALFYGWVVRIEFGDRVERPTLHQENVPLTKGLVVAITVALSVFLVVYVSIPAAQANGILLQITRAAARADGDTLLTLRQRALTIRTPYVREVRKTTGLYIAQIFSDPHMVQKIGTPELWQAGVQDLRESIRQFPLETDDRYHLVQLLFQGIKYDSEAFQEAEKVAKEAIPFSPKRQSLQFVLARALVLQKRPIEAVNVLRETVALDPGVRDSHWFLGIALRDAGDSSGAYEEIKKALALDYAPTNGDAWGAVSNLAEVQGDKAGAFWYAGRALQADGKLLEAYRMFGNAVASGYRWKDSTDVFLLSYLARDVGEYSVAYRLIKNELGPWMSKLDPIEYDARLAEAAFRAGDFFTAYGAADRAVRARPSLKARLAPILAPGAGRAGRP